MQLQNDKTVYFRRKNKTTYAINFKKNINYRSLHLLLSKRQSITQENIVLIHHGKIIQSSFPFEQLENKSIIHVIDMIQVKKQILQVNFKYLNNTIKKMKVNPSSIIQEFIKDNLAKIDLVPYFYVGLVYGGKILSPSKTFIEEYVQNQCQIIVVNINDYLDKKVKQQSYAEQKLQNPQKDVDVTIEIKTLSHQQKVCSNDLEKDQIINQRNNKVKETAGSIQLFTGNDNLVSKQNKQNEAEQEDKQLQDPPPFNIRISQVNSVSTEEDQRNNVNFNQNYPFQTIPSTNQENVDQIVLNTPMKQSLGESQLSLNDFIFVGNDYQNLTKSYIQKLMKKYRIVL